MTTTTKASVPSRTFTGIILALVLGGGIRGLAILGATFFSADSLLAGPVSTYYFVSGVAGGVLALASAVVAVALRRQRLAALLLMGSIALYDVAAVVINGVNSVINNQPIGFAFPGTWLTDSGIIDYYNATGLLHVYLLWIIADFGFYPAIVIAIMGLGQMTEPSEPAAAKSPAAKPAVSTISESKGAAAKTTAKSAPAKVTPPKPVTPKTTAKTTTKATAKTTAKTTTAKKSAPKS